MGEAARLRMAAVHVREQNVQRLQDRADAQMAEAVALMEAARRDSQEYQRAIYHYTQLVRHRMANPLQTISGMALTLRDQRDLDPQLRHQMIEAIYEQAQALERICLEPQIVNDAERELRPRPEA